MEMQSSPVLMLVLRILIRDALPMWIPSVLGLSPAVVMVTWSNVRFLPPITMIWNCLLSLLVIPCTIALVT
ncbi:hypothetical protein LINPERHAP2_LOCUS33819 [Linum perenne]